MTCIRKSFNYMLFILGLLWALPALPQAKCTGCGVGVGRVNVGTSGQTACFDATGLAIVDCLTPTLRSTLTGFGIGTAIPATAAHVVKGLEGSVPSLLSFSTLVIQHNEFSTSNALISLLAGTSGKSIVEFADSGDRDIGFISYDHLTNSFTFGTNTAAQMAIDNSGNVGIGVTVPDNIFHIFNTLPIIKLQDTVDGIASTSFMEFWDVDSRLGIIGVSGGADNNVTILADTAGADIVLTPNATGDIFLNGDVGIRTNNPSVALDIFDPTPNIRLQDSVGTTSVTAGAFIEFWHTTARYGWIGYGSSSNDDISVTNESTGGHVRLDPGSGGDLKVVGTDSDFYTEGQGWQEFTTTTGGFISTTIQEVWFKRVGKMVIVNFHINGTSDATTMTFTLPFVHVNNTDVEVRVGVRVADAGVFQAASGMIFLAANSSIVNVFQDFAGLAFTATGIKAVQGQLWYQTP